MRTNTIERRWDKRTSQVTYLVKVDGVSAGLFFTADELHALSDNIHKALGATDDHNAHQ